MLCESEVGTMKRYVGQFNWYGEVHVLSTNAPSKSAAYSIFTRVLSKKLRRIPSAIRAYFNGTKDNYNIREEVKK
jgi:hypothetical protein